MNERIHELSEQAQLYARQGMVQSAIKGLDADTMSEKYARDFEEKFAELIVRECMKQAHSVGDLRGVNDDMIYGADYAAVQISKYFGVE